MHVDLCICMGKKKSIEEKLDALFVRVDKLETENAELREENATLKKRLSHYETPKNSKNCSKPPSSDFPKLPRTQSLRKKSGKKPGGQKGHKGNTLKMVDEPTVIKEHSSNYCTCCGNNLADIEGAFAGRRQVIDIPPIVPVVTEHRVYHKQCSCGMVNKGCYPNHVNAPVSYGTNTQALAAYMHTRQYMPYHRLREFFNTILGLKISTGGLNHLIIKFAKKATPFYEQIRNNVHAHSTMGADETGTNINGKLHWAWVFQNAQSTFLSVHHKRGYDAIEEIMPEGFKNNTLVTDCWKPYFKTQAGNHQLCTAHLLRELEFFIQKYPHSNWASKMKSLIVKALKTRTNNWDNKDAIVKILKAFAKLLTIQIDETLKEVVTFKNRLVRYADYVFTFLNHPDVPPDNNGSERAVRNFKVKQKVSGFFKSFEGAKHYAIQRSIIDTAIKSSHNPFDTLRAIAII